MLYELLVGEPPFAGDSLVSIVFQHISDPPTPPSAADPEISAEIDAITLKALAKDPSNRYQTASEMKADIDKVLSGDAPAATTVLPMIKSSDARVDQAHPGHRQKAARIVTIMGALVLVTICASAFAITNSTRSQAMSPRTTEVPAVLGLDQVAAESLLRNAHLVPRFEFVRDADGASIDTAINQSPVGGHIATIDSDVIVAINIGPRRASIPLGLVGRDIDQVRKVLRRAGFRNVKAEKVTLSFTDATAGQVMWVAPAGGQTVPLGQRITLTYAGVTGHAVTRMPSVGDGRNSSSKTDSGSPQDLQARQSAGSGGPDGTRVGRVNKMGDSKVKGKPEKSRKGRKS
jgi:beta-lactam-binding protein with PASTA domain